MEKSYTLIPIKANDKVWALPEALMEKYELKTGDTVILKCGNAVTEVLVQRLSPGPNGQKKVTGLSEEVFKDLIIPVNITLNIKPVSDKEFRLGPVIGIMTFPGHLPSRLGYYGSYTAVIKNVGLSFVFRGGAVDHRTQTVKGYYYDYTKKQWILREFPYPDAVFDKCYPNPFVIHNRLEKVLGPGKIFNKNTMINKLHFWNALKKNSFLKNHTPQTQYFQGPKDLTSYLENYKQVFLKPVNGMKGLGIIVASPAENGAVDCQYVIKGKLYKKQIASVEEIWNIILAAAGRIRPYIIQQGIDRMEYLGGPISIRTWAMKNGKGQWVIPGMFSKGSFGSGFLTNFTAGAKLIPLNDLFNGILPRVPYNKEELLAMINRLSLETAEILDVNYGPLGELGFDIVFDNEGKPWIIEANGNPGNIPIFMQKEYPLWRHQIFIYPMEYATYLAGF